MFVVGMPESVRCGYAATMRDTRDMAESSQSAALPPQMAQPMANVSARSGEKTWEWRRGLPGFQGIHLGHKSSWRIDEDFPWLHAWI